MDKFNAFTLTSVRKSPLGGAKHGSPGIVALCEKPFVPSFNLRVKPGSLEFSAVADALGLPLPTIVGQSQQRTMGNEPPVNALCLGPDWWFILGEIDAIPLLEPVRAKAHFSIVDVSAQRTQIEIQGPCARKVLEHLWEQDLRETHFGIGSCTQGLMAKAPIVLWHLGQNRYNISVRSSFVRHLWEAMVDACVEYLG